jgi:hypothetical protein
MPLFELPWREHRLLSGPLDAALEIGSLVNGVLFPHSLRPPPSPTNCCPTRVPKPGPS